MAQPLEMWRILACLLVLTSVAHAQQVAPCTFNSMCSCKFGSTETHVIHFTTPRSLDSVRDVSCVSVPFSRLPDLPGGWVAHVDVVSSGLESLDAEMLANAQVESLRLMSNKLQIVSPRAFASSEEALKSLDLSYNELEEVPFEAMNALKNLDWLNLHSNQIASIAGDWSRTCATLTNMFLGENELISLPRESVGTVNGGHEMSLAQCEKLSWLNLDSNKLRTIDPQSLPPSLQTLSVSHNMLTRFPSDVVDALPELAWLYLRDNHISHLVSLSFKLRKRFDTLDLGDNGIKSIPMNLFNGSVTIRDLKLDQNYISGLPQQAFKGLNIVRLYLSTNRLRSQDIDERAFVGLGHSLEYLDLERNNMDYFPRALGQLKRLKYLYVSSNNISTLPDWVFSSFNSSLRALSLESNQLSRIPYGALRECRKLTHLNVGYNQIHTVEDHDFEHWGTALDTLLLRNNRIDRLGANLFRHTPRLRELSLSFNTLEYIDPETFADLANSLESLEISFGMDKEIFPVDLLRPLVSLSWLALDNNQLRTIGQKDLHSFKKLQYLNLESNQLSSIPPGLFDYEVHGDLRDIRLSYNNLETIELETFSGLQSLKTIVLNGNRIRSVQSYAFSDMASLVTLMLSDNRISNLAPRAFQQLPSLLRLDLQGNELKELTLASFMNVTTDKTPMALNLSHNQLSAMHVSDADLFVRVLDLSHNQLPEVPKAFLQKLSNSLRRLYIGFNRLSRIENHGFGNLPLLEELTLPHNSIVNLKQSSFVGSGASLQSLDISHNHVETLQPAQFGELPLLRVLDLSYNHVRAIPRDAFLGTSLERLDLSYNELIALPTAALSDVGSTLRQLNLAHNNIEHLDSTMFQEIPHLLSLTIANNKLTLLPDNVFSSIGGLLSLDVSSNPIRANFKELFHYVQGLRSLSMADINLRVLPPLPLPHLVTLNLTDNLIHDLPANSVQGLARLRVLVLNGNRMTTLPSQAWSSLPKLRHLSLGRNPIKIITKESFSGLSRIQSLDLVGLASLERFDVDALTRLHFLSTLRIQTWPHLEKSRFHLGASLSSLVSLRHLSVEVLERSLTDQLVGAITPKLRRLEIAGRSLSEIASDALDGIQDKHELTFQLRDTLVDELPAGLVGRLAHVAQLTLDLRNNRFSTLSPSSLYPNGSNWENVGTRPYSGGIALSGNPWTCECGLVWLGRWLRRWLRETMQIHTVVLEGAQRVTRAARAATCWDARSGRQVPLLELRAGAGYGDLACHASALSHGGTAPSVPRTHALLSLALTLLLFL